MVWARPDVWYSSIVDTKRVASDSQLVHAADLIVYGRYDTAMQVIRTNRKVRSGKLVNYIQHFHVRHAFKGSTGPIIRIVSTGVEPLPQPGKPIHKTYPGPVAEGAYLIFLKKINGRDLYRLIGGWQGLYPVENGKLVALQDAGFPVLQGMPIEQVKAYIEEKRT